uniref:Hyccin n=1 Tax=Leersia perrieri TaxID=77586 RepID=A0A0D9XPH6_9ORYZ
MPPSPAAAGAASPSNSSSASASDPTPSWWESVSQARSRILALSSILPPPADSDVAALADSDRPARALLRSPASYAALSAALRSGGGADDPACHWLYDTLLSPDPDLRLAALAFLPLLSSLYLLRLPPALPSSLSGFEAVLLAVYSSEAKNRQGKPVLVQVPDLSVPSLYHTPLSSPSSKSPRRQQPPPIPPPAGNVVVGVLSPPLEPQAAVKSTKRAGIIGVAFEAYYAKISQMPAASKVDACNAVAAWAGQYCKCRFELDEELDGEEADSLGSVSPLSSSEAENGKALEEEMAKMRVNGDSNGRNCGEREGRVPLPWELLQPVMRVLGHCLLAPLNPAEVRDAAAEAVRVVYARSCHELVPQAILASRSLIELDKSARKAAKAADAAASGAIVSVGTAGSTASSSRPSSKPNTPGKQRKPDVLLVSK